MGSLGAAMDRGRGHGSGTAKRRPASRRLLPCWLQRPISPAAACSADLTRGFSPKGWAEAVEEQLRQRHGDGEEGQYQALSAKSLGRLKTQAIMAVSPITSMTTAVIDAL